MGEGAGAHLDPTGFIFLFFSFCFCCLFCFNAVLAGLTTTGGLMEAGGRKEMAHLCRAASLSAPGAQDGPRSGISCSLRSVMMLDVRFRVGAASYWTVRPPTPFKRLVKMVVYPLRSEFPSMTERTRWSIC